MPEYRVASSVHLHDQRVVICESINEAGVDSFWSAEEVPEYPLSATLIRRLAEIAGARLKDDDFTNIGIHRAYAVWPSEFTLHNLGVRIVSDRMIDIRMRLSPESNKPDEQWTEEWTYSGAFTIVWAGE